MSSLFFTSPPVKSVSSRALRLVALPLLALVVATASLVLDIDTADAQGIAAPNVCAVTNADAGAFVFWSAVNGANEYVYATRFNNGPERFDRTPESSLFIPSDEGRVTAMRVATVVGGATSNSTICSVDGQGGPPPPPPPPTRPPATQPPATQPPTRPPATQPPATQPPATQPPATQPPATQPPATQPPATQPPATQPPATQPPATQPPTSGDCAVTADTIGVAATWTAIPHATQYVYALRYDGALRYDRVNSTSTIIAVKPGVDINLQVSAVFADGSYSPAVDCGTARTVDGSTGGCTTQAIEGAILVDYPAVDGATSYVFSLRVNSGTVFYDRVMFTSLKLDIGSGATGAVRVSAVFDDGSFSQAVTCASTTAR